VVQKIDRLSEGLFNHGHAPPRAIASPNDKAVKNKQILYRGTPLAEKLASMCQDPVPFVPTVWAAL